MDVPLMPKTERFLGAALLALSIFLIVIAQEMPQAFVYKQIGPGLWPTSLAVVLAFCGVALFFDGLVRSKRSEHSAPSKYINTRLQEKKEEINKKGYISTNNIGINSNNFKVLLVAVLSCALVFFAKRVGFIPSVSVFMFLTMTTLGYRPYLKTALIAVLLTFGIVFAFSTLMGVPLPEGTGIFRDINSTVLQL